MIFVYLNSSWLVLYGAVWYGICIRKRSRKFPNSQGLGMCFLFTKNRFKRTSGLVGLVTSGALLVYSATGCYTGESDKHLSPAMYMYAIPTPHFPLPQGTSHEILHFYLLSGSSNLYF